jgi:hypothetical protein
MSFLGQITFGAREPPINEQGRAPYNLLRPGLHESEYAEKRTWVEA